MLLVPAAPAPLARTLPSYQASPTHSHSIVKQYPGCRFVQALHDPIILTHTRWASNPLRGIGSILTALVHPPVHSLVLCSHDPCCHPSHTNFLLLAGLTPSHIPHARSIGARLRGNIYRRYFERTLQKLYPMIGDPVGALREQHLYNITDLGLTSEPRIGDHIIQCRQVDGASERFISYQLAQGLAIFFGNSLGLRAHWGPICQVGCEQMAEVNHC